MGSGMPRDGEPYHFLHAASVDRSHFSAFPSLPTLRGDVWYEDLTFAANALRHFRLTKFDVTLACSYPWVNWLLRLPGILGTRPPHVFVTQNGDWPAYAQHREYRFFGCDGLICTNPDFYERNSDRWRSALIPNGVDLERFRPGPSAREEFKLPRDRTIILMASALISSKRVEAGIEAVSHIADAHLVVAGDGPLRPVIEKRAAALLPDRFTRLSIAPDRMPFLYRSADVFLHLAKDESFGNVFVEALACGLPVVAIDTRRTRWIVGDDEFLVDSDDPLTISRGIQQARNASLQHERRAAKAAPFSWSKVAQQYEQFLREIVK